MGFGMIDRFNHSGRGLHIESDRAMKRKSTVLVPSNAAGFGPQLPERELPDNKRATPPSDGHGSPPVFPRERSDAGSELGESFGPLAISVKSPVPVSLRTRGNGPAEQSSPGNRTAAVREWEEEGLMVSPTPYTSHKAVAWGASAALLSLLNCPCSWTERMRVRGANALDHAQAIPSSPTPTSPQWVSPPPHRQRALSPPRNRAQRLVHVLREVHERGMAPPRGRQREA